MSDGNSTSERKFFQVGRNTFATSRGLKTPGLFLKLPVGWPGGSEYPVSQYLAYQDLRPYLRMPNVKIVNGRGELCTRVVNNADQYLVVDRVEGERFDQALLSSPEKFSRAAKVFITDLTQMWQQTKSRVADSQVAPDLRESLRKEPLETIKAFITSEETKDILDVPLVINGRQYPSIREICNQFIARLTESTDPVVVRGHGDEHFQNLFAQEKEGQTTYMIIDPRRRLYRRSPAAAVNTFVGSFLLFVFDYKIESTAVESKNGKRFWQIDYKTIERYKNGYARVLACGREMVKALADLHEGGFLIREYLFANLIRSYIGRVADKYQDKVRKSREAHLAMAVELYTDFEGFLNGKYSA